MIVYLATNTVNGMQYVGLTRRTVLERRVFEHRSSSRRGAGKENTLAHAMRVYGEDVFSFRVIQRVQSLEALSAAERYWIRAYNTNWPNGYNVKKGGCHTDPLTTGKRYRIQGGIYYGCGQLGDAFGIDPRTIRARLEKSGWTLRQAVGVDDPPEREGVPSLCKPITFRGKQYASRSALCRVYNVPLSNFEARRKYGWSLEEALELVKRPKVYSKPLNPVTAFGKDYSCLAEASRCFGEDLKRVYDRMHNLGWSIEDALTGERSEPHGGWTIYTVNSKEYVGQDAVASAHGLTKQQFRSRLNRGHTLEQSLGIEKGVGQRGKKYVIDGKEYFGMQNLAEAFNLTTDKINTRLKRGYSLRQALELDKGMWMPRGKKHIVNGKTYYGHRELADAFGLTTATVSIRMSRKGLSAKEAVGLK
jgi:hypothetical protein